MRSIERGALNAGSPLSFNRVILSFYLRRLLWFDSMDANVDAGHAASRLTAAILTSAAGVARENIERMRGIVAAMSPQKAYRQRAEQLLPNE